MLKLLISNSWEAFVGFWVGHHILFPFYVFFMYLNAQEEKQVYYFKISKILVETNRKQFQRLKIYNGIKYALNEFEEFYSGHGSRRQYTVTETSQQNGVVERKNCMLMDRVWSTFSLVVKTRSSMLRLLTDICEPFSHHAQGCKVPKRCGQPNLLFILLFKHLVVMPKVWILKSTGLSLMLFPKTLFLSLLCRWTKG